MLSYEVSSLPDLSLSKYQVFADSGISGMLEAQTQFLRQIYRLALLCRMGIHVLFSYDPRCRVGHRLRIFLCFSGVDAKNSVAKKIERVVRSSGVSTYYQLCRIDSESLPTRHYRCRGILAKRERFLQTVVDSRESYFYLVPNWELNEDSRLFSLLRLMGSFNEPCAYRVDLMAECDLDVRMHEGFERPLSFLRNIDRREAGLSERSRHDQALRDPNADTVLKQYNDWLDHIDASALVRCRVLALADDADYAQLILDAALTETVAKGTGDIAVSTGDFGTLDEMGKAVDERCSEDVPRAMRTWTTTFLIEEAAAFLRLPVLYDGESVELPKETAPQQSFGGGCSWAPTPSVTRRPSRSICFPSTCSLPECRDRVRPIRCCTWPIHCGIRRFLTGRVVLNNQGFPS